MLAGAYDDAKQYLALFKANNVKGTARFSPDSTSWRIITDFLFFIQT
jgi:hypothetical protein